MVDAVTLCNCYKNNLQITKLYITLQKKNTKSPERGTRRGRAVVARKAHILEVDGANPSPASKKELAF